MTTLRIGHSPDADDAFMFFGFAQGAINTGDYQVVHVVEDIESLNKRAIQGELEMTAISAAAYPEVAHHYRIMACGASIGRNYGPLIVARHAMDPQDLAGKVVGIPGLQTTSFLLLRIYYPDVVPRLMPFDQIMDVVARGELDAGIIINEGQITYDASKVAKVVDLGEAWFADTGLPIPLGLDMVHRRLGEEEAHRLYRMFLDSILYARANDAEANDYAHTFSRGIELDLSRRFVGMYVNEDTLQMGEEGRRALEALFQRAHDHGLIQKVPPLDIIGLE